MPGAKFSLGIFLIAGALPGLAHFDLLFRRRGLGGGSGTAAAAGGVAGGAGGGAAGGAPCGVVSSAIRRFPSLVRMRVRSRFLRLSFVSYSNPSRETKREFGGRIRV